MTSWPQVSKCWKVDNGDDFDAKALELYFPASKDHEGAEARKAIWKAMDNNGNKYVSLAEYDGCSQHTGRLEAKAGRKPVPVSTIFTYARPVLIRAFTLANGSPHQPT